MTRHKALLTHTLITSITIALLYGLVITVSGWTAHNPAGRTHTQSDEKQIERGNLIYASDPLKISEVKVGNKLAKLNEKFEGNDDWLKGVNLKLKNISNREIVHIQLDFDFPETAVDGPVLAHQMMLGRRPGAVNQMGAPLSLAPGAVLNVAVDESVYADFEKILNYRPLKHALNRVRIRIGFVIFADGTGYGPGGTFYRQDPNNPARYLPIP